MEIAKTIAPIALAIIMFGLGLGLTIDDFKRVVKYPRDFIICLKKPDEYFGAEKFFGDPLAKQSDTPYTVILSNQQENEYYSIDEDEDKHVEDRVPKSLQTAIIDFIISGIVRKLRREKKKNK